MIIDIILLFSAGFFGGVLNSIAGGGSFITFPALLFVGIPPIIANATNTYASFPGYLSGAFAFRKELAAYPHDVWKAIILGSIGGGIGAWLLLQLPNTLFEKAIPWLLLIAVILFIFGPSAYRTLQKWHTNPKRQRSLKWAKIATFSLAILYFTICLYGGFFNAGLGIIVLAYLALAGMQDINAMNGLKLLTSSFVSLSAIILFLIQDAIAWYQGSLVLLGTLVGGYLAADLSRKIPQTYIRACVIVASCSITAYFFYQNYFASA